MCCPACDVQSPTTPPFTPTCGDTNPDLAKVTGFACGEGFVLNPAASANTTLSNSSCCLQVRQECVCSV
jgi:hypothetical protein